MDKKEHITSSEKSLLFLKTIEQSPQITQRDLSQKLGLSLGKINFLVNALVDKGIIKTRNFTNSNNKYAYLYFLTPRGLKAKIDLTHKFLSRKTEEYDRLREEIEVLNKEVAALKP